MSDARRVLPADAVHDAAPWQLPTVAGPVANRFVGNSPPSAATLEEIQAQAYREAYETGLQDGRAAGKEQLRREAAHLTDIVDALSQPFDQLSEEVESQVVELAMVVVQHLFRRAVKIDPGQIVGLVRRALHVLPTAARDVRIFLHPDDAALVRETLVEAEGERAWRIVEDPVLTRGGCRVATETSRIDARVESRLSSIISAVAGDERTDER